MDFVKVLNVFCMRNGKESGVNLTFGVIERMMMLFIEKGKIVRGDFLKVR